MTRGSLKLSEPENGGRFGGLKSFLKRAEEFAAFTKNEQRVFFLLAAVFLIGASIRIYRAYFVPPPVRQFDYTALDKEFEERSKHLTSIGQAPAKRDSAGRSEKKSVPSVVKLNSAGKAELVALPGVGDGTAERILAYRAEHGRFTSIDELKKVKGIGGKKFERLRPYLRLQ